MFDLHYDLLSILYLSYLKNDFYYINSIKKSFGKDNVKALIANLYFMSKEEMDLECSLYGEIDCVEMFRISTQLYKEHFPNIPAIFSIEGCDYIKSKEELDELYELGLRSILLVWNNKNIYGSGPREESGITKLGEEFIAHAIKLGIAIDFSHANIKTFDGIYKVVLDMKDYNPICFASHSNAYSLTQVTRNLNDEQLEKLRDIDALVGVVSYKAFLTDNNYLEHILYIASKIGVSNLVVSSDDMTFDPEYADDALFAYRDIAASTKELLMYNFTENEISSIMYDNAYNKLKNLFYKEV